ncbi:hypothetical protein CR513_36122, partial [Mucuna pruriens]
MTALWEQCSELLSFHINLCTAGNYAGIYYVFVTWEANHILPLMPTMMGTLVHLHTSANPMGYNFDDELNRSSGKAVLGWLKLKAALRWDHITTSVKRLTLRSNFGVHLNG